MEFPAIMYKGLTPPVGVAIPYLHDYGIAARFLETVQINPDAAWAFVSKICAQSLDLEALREVLGADVSFRQVQSAVYLSDTKNSMTRSVYVEDPKHNLRRLLHLRLIKEPDRNGVWKVYGVEEAEVRGLEVRG